MTRVHLWHRTLKEIHTAATPGGQNTAHDVGYGIIIYSRNGHVPRLNLYFSFVIYSRINILWLLLHFKFTF